jgi:hypothetical protein
MDLIDAMAGNTSARSPVELSLNPLFRRQYGSLHDAVDNFLVPTKPEKVQEERQAHQKARMRIVAEQCPKPENRPFYLFGIDSTTQPRPFADTLEDRAVQYHPNPAPGNQPVTVGHAYSTLAALPEKVGRTSPPWVMPLLIRRVPTDRKTTEVGAEQARQLFTDEALPFAQAFSALTGDTAYSACEFLGQAVKLPNLVTIVRVRSNRVFFGVPEQVESSPTRGHPRWYGTSFDMKDASTWDEPDATIVVPFIFRNGRECQVSIQAWHNLLMHGKRAIPMHEHPFTLICITVKDSDQKPVFKRPLWLILIGARRDEVSLSEAYEAYRQRYDLEHFFRFGKNRLLMASFQTPDVEHEENWWEMVGLAYAQLYVAAPLARNHARPWERYLPEVKQLKEGDFLSPSTVQRSLPEIIGEIGSPAGFPKPRGKSPGRRKGQSPGKRDRHRVIFKSKRRTDLQARAP